MKHNIRMRFPEGRGKALTFSYDDGVIEDIRLIEILNRHGMKGTFNLNSGLYKPEDEESDNRRLTKAQATELYRNGGHEVACHAYIHPSLATLPLGRIAYEVIKDRELLEEQFGTVVRGMAYPNGSVSDEVVEVLRSCGIVYSRTVEATEKFRLPQNWLRLPATCHHNNPRLMELAHDFVEAPVKNEPLMFYLWGHSYEFDDRDNWNVIEEFTDFMSGRENEIWYATNMEIYEYIHDYEQLIWSAEGSLVRNPTARTLYFEYCKKIYSIGAGQTMHIE